MTAGRDLQVDDLHETLVAFYALVEKEPLLAPYFQGIDMIAHMPRIASFWATMIFHTGTYIDWIAHYRAVWTEHVDRLERLLAKMDE